MKSELTLPTLSACLAVVLLAGCGGSDEPQPAAPAPAQPPSPQFQPPAPSQRQQQMQITLQQQAQQQLDEARRAMEARDYEQSVKLLLAI